MKSILACEDEEYAKEFKYFNRDVLKKVQKEMHEKTECRYTYEPVKKGRKVVAIRFTVETLPKLTIDSDYDPNQYTLDDWQSNKRDEICHGFSSPEFEDFTQEQLELLKDLGWSRKRDADYQKHKALLNDTVLACEYAVSDYLRQTIIMQRPDTRRTSFCMSKRWSRVTASKAKI